MFSSTSLYCILRLTVGSSQEGADHLAEVRDWLYSGVWGTVSPIRSSKVLGVSPIRSSKVLGVSPILEVAEVSELVLILGFILECPPFEALKSLEPTHV